MSDFKAIVHQIRFRLGFSPDPTRGAYSAPQVLQLDLQGPTSNARGWEVSGRTGRGERGEGDASKY